MYKTEGEKHFGEVKLRLTACLRRNVRLTTFINVCLLKIREVCDMSALSSGQFPFRIWEER